MGILNFWPFIHQKGYIADSFKTITAAVAGIGHATPPRFLVDVQATFYATIRYAYTHKEITTAHNILRHAIEKTGLTTAAVLYLDGSGPEEKQQTHNDRAAKCHEALKRAENALATLQDRVRTDKRVHKHHFGNVVQNAKDGFRWSMEERVSFAGWMRQEGWTVVESPFEADVAIAADCTPNDVVVSTDSDYFGYSTVNTILRPFHGNFCRYDVGQVMAHLGLSRDQLTALCIVSKNDYTSNITRLGPETNLKLISKLRVDDVHAIVEEYLRDESVRRKNTTNESFAASLRVFVRRQQSAVSEVAQQDDQQSFRNLLRELETVKQEYIASKQISASSSTTRKLSPDKGPSNIFQTVDRKHERQPKPHPSGRPYKYRRRYSSKLRTPKVKYPPPDMMKMYKWKRPKEPPNQETDTTSKGRDTKKRRTSKYEKKDVELMDKKGLVYTMQHEHPLVSLTVGTVNYNVTRALERSSKDVSVKTASDSLVASGAVAAPTQKDLAFKIKKCLKDVVRLASETKRICQRAVAVYIHRVFKNGVSEQDRRVLDKICGRISEDDQDDDDDNNDADADDDKDKKPENAFMFSLLICIYNRRLPNKSQSSAEILHFVDQVKDVLPAMGDSSAIIERMPYPASTVLRSTATTLATSTRQHFGRGAKTVMEKAKTLQKKGHLGADVSCKIDTGISAVENFQRFNKITGNHYKVAPMSSMEDGYITLSELDLIHLFCKDQDLKYLLQRLAAPEYPSTSASSLSERDLQEGISDKDPGFLITKLITDVGTYNDDEIKKQRRYRRNTTTFSLRTMKDHLGTIRHCDFCAANYKENRYVLRGSIKTDGYQLQLLAFKTKVLHSVKYRRLDENKLPPGISTTMGGTDYYMTEIRNVIQSPDDVTRLWGCRPEEVKVLGIDLGKAFVVGACALVPAKNGGRDEVKTLNLAVNQRAVYQPVFKHRRWSEHKKTQTTSSGATIKEIESNLPPLRGNDADVEGYVSRVRDVEATLVSFYSDDDRESWKRHRFDLKKAFDEEFRVVADSLLRMVGGTSSAPRDENNKVLIVIGLGDFRSNSRLSSLHSSFKTYFVELARSLGYVVCGANEFYTSKRCPRCEQFVGQVTIRRLYCPSPTCQTYVHRDVLGGHNIANIGRYRLMHGARPLYLQPMDSQGRHLWTNSGGSSSGGESSNRKRPCPE